MTECYLLTVMALDRYLDICHPLHYHTLMSRQVQLWLAGATLAAGFSAALVPASLTATLPFCLKEVAHYFCDLALLMQLACVDIGWHSWVHIVVIGLINACNIVLILGLYGGILRAVLKLPSATSRAKAFSTCSSHMTVVTLFFGSAFIVYVGPPGIRAKGMDKFIALVHTLIHIYSDVRSWQEVKGLHGLARRKWEKQMSIFFMYVRLKKSYSLDYDWALAVVYSVLTPFLNPFIYSLRNKEIKEAVRRQLKRARILG
ncbi:olfactory receptor 6S1-like isoform X2 [Trichechus manatus latirostris]|nr:olfactory receptor 6S1-like isoform X2 [Trichechus manatus latirostris]